MKEIPTEPTDVILKYKVPVVITEPVISHGAHHEFFMETKLIG